MDIVSVLASIAGAATGGNDGMRLAMSGIAGVDSTGCPITGAAILGNDGTSIAGITGCCVT